MKRILLLVTILTAGALALAAQTPTVDQLKAQLVGHTMGGREKSWKFQSIEQIQDLVVRNKIEDRQKLRLTVSMKLQASGSSPKYAAEARIECGRTAAGGWEIKQVGLLSISKVE